MTRRTMHGALALGVMLAVPLGTLAADDPSPSAAASPSAPPTPTAWLGGPFGTVPGGSVSRPATAAPDGRPLDTWMRRAQLELTADPPVVELGEVTVVATSVDGAAMELPVQGARWFLAPDEPGLHVITATFSSDDAASEHAWLVDVPDQEGSWETLLELPSPGAELRAAGRAAAGERGHGCHVGMCQEVGYRPPAGALTPLVLPVGEPVELHLSDGSALVHWEGRLEPQPGTRAETRLAQATFDEPVAGPVLTGLEPDVAGEWLLELRADYDRHRGWQWFLFRLIAE